MDIINDARELAVAEINEYGSPLLIHLELSENKAVELAQKLKADETIVKLGAYLMDVKIGQAIKENRLSEHIVMSAAAAREFLKKYDLQTEMVEKIINCIEAHHKTVPFNCLEAEICANADCYRFLHPRGFFAYLVLLGSREGDFKKALDLGEKKLEEKISILSLDICHQELDGYYKTLKQFIAAAKG